eukprot:m.455647 g.455647  ORF g.455647 m.455647 type:complete len:368 (+) comp20911_c0_seq1:200-1303(+)
MADWWLPPASGAQHAAAPAESTPVRQRSPTNPGSHHAAGLNRTGRRTLGDVVSLERDGPKGASTWTPAPVQQPLWSTHIQVDDPQFRARHDAPRRHERRQRFGDRKPAHAEELEPVMRWSEHGPAVHARTASQTPSCGEPRQVEPGTPTLRRRATHALGDRKPEMDEQRSYSRYAAAPGVLEARRSRLAVRKTVEVSPIATGRMDATPPPKHHPGFTPSPVVHRHHPDKLNLFSGPLAEMESAAHAEYRGILPTIDVVSRPIRRPSVGPEWAFGRDPNGRTETHSYMRAHLSPEAAGWHALEAPSSEPFLGVKSRPESTHTTCGSESHMGQSNRHGNGRMMRSGQGLDETFGDQPLSRRRDTIVLSD